MGDPGAVSTRGGGGVVGASLVRGAAGRASVSSQGAPALPGPFEKDAAEDFASLRAADA